MAQTMKGEKPQTSRKLAGTGIPGNIAGHSADILNQLLGDEFTIYLKARKYHWNVNGPMFNDLHSFFEMVYQELEASVDEIAERVRQLGFHAEGTMKEFLDRTVIAEEPGVYHSDREMTESLLADFETVIRSIRGNLENQDTHGDEGTAHFLVDIMLRHEKKAWMMRSLLQGWKQ